MKARARACYKKINSIFFGRDPINKNLLPQGPVTVAVLGSSEFRVEGNINRNGLLTGMSALYSHLTIEADDTLEFELIQPNQLILRKLTHASGAIKEFTEGTPVVLNAPKYRQTVFARKAARHIHIEAFRPENLQNWEPENEPDIYIALGVLQEFTGYRYCCATSKNLLSRLGIIDDATRPDAILIDNNTGEYLVAEFKMTTSDFTKNHSKEDVDILVVWIDDSTFRDKLPENILCLQNIARIAAHQTLDEQ